MFTKSSIDLPLRDKHVPRQQASCKMVVRYSQLAGVMRVLNDAESTTCCMQVRVEMTPTDCSSQGLAR